VEAFALITVQRQINDTETGFWTRSMRLRWYWVRQDGSRSSPAIPFDTIADSAGSATRCDGVQPRARELA
jgi:hypothetical protein